MLDSKITLRIPSTVRAQVEALADQDRRSTNNEFLVLVEEALEHRKRSGSLPPPVTNNSGQPSGQPTS